jgi:hypothetical protein
MNPLAAWWLPGTRGLATPAPLEFASLLPTPSADACLALPEGHPGPAGLRTPPLAAAPDAVFETLLALADSEPHSTRLATWPERRQAQWVIRSARLRFPDLVVAEARPAGAGTALFLCSRRLIGWSAPGAQRARMERWIEALDRIHASAPEALSAVGVAEPRHDMPSAPAQGEPEEEAAPPPAAPWRLARALAARAAGRHVLITGPHFEAPFLLLEALAAGAASARVLHPLRTAGADMSLRVWGARLGLADLANEVLENAGLGETLFAPPPFADSQAPPTWWLAEALDTPDLSARIGAVDLVFDGAGLHRHPEPWRHLLRLRGTGARWLLLTTQVVPEGLLAEPLAAGALDAATSARLDAGLRAAGLELPQLTALAEGLTAEVAGALGLGELWWWFLPESGVAPLLAEAGWVVRAARREGLELLIEAEAG